MSVCTVEGCGKTMRARGWCATHYSRWRTNGDPLKVQYVRLAGTPAERFWGHVKKTDSCWMWLAAKGDFGHGKFHFQGRFTMAHRVAWTLLRGPIPPGKHLDHRCHQPACVNPAHLRIATPKQNSENRAGAQINNQSSGIRGVSWSRQSQSWAVQVKHHGKNHHGGHFADLDEAAEAARQLRLSLFTFNDLDRKEHPMNPTITPDQGPTPEQGPLP